MLVHPSSSARIVQVRRLPRDSLSLGEAKRVFSLVSFCIVEHRLSFANYFHHFSSVPPNLHILFLVTMLCMVTVIYTHFKLYNEATSQKCGVRLVFACTVTYISVQLTVKGGDGVPLTCEHLPRFYTTEKKEPQIITLLKAREFNQRHLNGVVQSITRDCITS